MTLLYCNFRAFSRARVWLHLQRKNKADLIAVLHIMYNYFAFLKRIIIYSFGLDLGNSHIWKITKTINRKIIESNKIDYRSNAAQNISISRSHKRIQKVIKCIKSIFLTEKCSKIKTLYFLTQIKVLGFLTWNCFPLISCNKNNWQYKNILQDLI